MGGRDLKERDSSWVTQAVRGKNSDPSLSTPGSKPCPARGQQERIGVTSGWTSEGGILYPHPHPQSGTRMSFLHWWL